MSPTVYNASLLVGLVLIGAGVGMLSVPAALVTVGALVIVLSVLGASLSRKG
jgi:hypothetical protein